MWKLLGLILPVLVPSWRFFRVVEASPRIEWTYVPEAHVPEAWQEVHARPHSVTPFEMVWRLFWNPAWNEALYLVSCAERLQHVPSPDIVAEIRWRVVRGIARQPGTPAGHLAMYRLLFVQSVDGTLVEEEVFRSEPFATTGGPGQ